jgi:hypothetical protein
MFGVSRVALPLPRDDVDLFQGCAPLTLGLGPLQGTASNPTNACSKTEMLNHRHFTTQALPRDACFVGAWPPTIVATGALPHGPPARVLATRPGHHCAAPSWW